MLPLQECFAPYRNSMAEQIKQSQEETWQEKEQAADKISTRYDIFGRGKAFGEPLSAWLTARDPR